MLLGNPPHLLPPALGGKSVLEVETIKYLGHHLDSDFVTHFLRTPTMKVDMLDFCTFQPRLLRLLFNFQRVLGQQGFNSQR